MEGYEQIPQQLGPQAAVRVRQKAAHELATLLAQQDSPVLAPLLEFLQQNNPTQDLLDLAYTAEGQADTFTLQLVLSCFTNLSIVQNDNLPQQDLLPEVSCIHPMHAMPASNHTYHH